MSWVKGQGIPPVVEELEGNAKLIWLTEKRIDRVLVYVHGAVALYYQRRANMYSFCARIREELLRRDDAKDFGIVVPVYSLLPAKFPTQLNQLTIALTHLLSSGVKQESVILLGDSAGGNLIMQLMVHTLHPFEGVAGSPIVSRASESKQTPSVLGGICLISPWLSLDTWTPSFVKNNDLDILAGRSLLYWGKAYLSDVPESYLPWIKPVLSAPVSQEPWKWLATLDEYVGRVLITAGGKENLLDDSLGLYDTLKNIPSLHLDLELDVEEEGIHGDPVLDAWVPQKDGGGLSDATMKIISWVGHSFAT
ncbi:alpha/beta-hydrolase [Gymnopus androsaceus JB14]|uniref:Alpha/beta-hydrolase n=1 Tax=Gymnopus androsaceus JB14 TaxID=1447944 RepID=A0A6A4HN26_9AGAR|nr:alpha/beta-hydrolase [Gymnopus androsaceus JB14]